MKFISARLTKPVLAVALAIGLAGTASAANAAESVTDDHVITYNVIDKDANIIESTVGHRGPLSLELHAKAIEESVESALLKPRGVVTCGSSTFTVFFHPSSGDPVCFDGVGISFVTINDVVEIGAGNHDINVTYTYPGLPGDGNFNASKFSITDTNTPNWTALAEDIED